MNLVLESVEHMSKTTRRSLDYAAIILLGWTLLYATPLSWWGFKAGQIAVADAHVDEQPASMSFDRVIWRPIRMSYSVKIRDLTRRRNVCDASSAPFTYRSSAVLPEPLDLAYWAPSDPRCANLPEGSYIAETCWTAETLFGGLLPKTACRESNVFRIMAPRGSAG